MPEARLVLAHVKGQLATRLTSRLPPLNRALSNSNVPNRCGLEYRCLLDPLCRVRALTKRKVIEKNPARGDMQLRAIKSEAEMLVRDHGPDAYRVAAELVLAARRGRNLRMEKFRTRVAAEVARRMQRLSGQGTAKLAKSSAERSSPDPSPRER